MNGSGRRYFVDAFDLKVKQVAAHDLPEAQERKSDRCEDGMGAINGATFDFAGIFADDFIPTGGGALILSAGVGDDGVDQVAHGIDLRGDGVGHVGAHLLVQ